VAGDNFLLLKVWVNLHSILYSKHRKKQNRVRLCITVVQGHSQSSKLVPIKSDFLLVFRCSYICLSSITSEIQGFTARKSPFLPTSSHVWSPHNAVPTGTMVWKFM